MNIISVSSVISVTFVAFCGFTMDFFCFVRNTACHKIPEGRKRESSHCRH